jgi:hypothetical protein
MIICSVASGKSPLVPAKAGTQSLRKKPGFPLARE